MKSVTKELMVNALKELLLVKPLNKITVRDIVTKCDASKQTFYNHFQDKYHLFLFSVSIVLQNNLNSAQKDAHSYEETVLGYYNSILADSKFYSSVVKDELATKEMIDCVTKYAKSYFCTRILDMSDEHMISDELSLAVFFYAIGSANLLVNWIQTGFKQSPSNMAKIHCECLPNVLKKYQ